MFLCVWAYDATATPAPLIMTDCIKTAFFPIRSGCACFVLVLRSRSAPRRIPCRQRHFPMAQHNTPDALQKHTANVQHWMVPRERE
jgi:hypothetical protein